MLSLVGLPEEADRKALLNQAPVGQVDRGGAECDVYRMEVDSAAGKAEIEALVDRGTQTFRSICRRIPNKPVMTVELVAVNKPVDDSLFVVGDTLTEDGRSAR